MEFLFLLILIVGAGCFALINGFLSVAREKKSFEQRLREQFGTIQAKKYDADRFERISGYYEKHEKPNQIDDITWNDLDMDEIYCRIDTTFSAVGEEYLYYLLRTPANKMPELESLERLITFFGQNERERIRVQILSRKLGHTGNFSLYDYLDFLEALELPGVWPAKIRNAAFIPMIALSFFSPVVGLCGILLLVIVGILTHMKGKGAIEPYFVSFGYILRLLEVNTLLCRESLPADIVDPEVFGKAIRHLSKLKRGAYWLGAGISTGGNPAEIIMDYIRMIFHMDLIQFYKMHKYLTGHRQDVDLLAGGFGRLEASISIASYRATLGDEWCVPQFHERTQIHVTDLYHPLLQNPVKNTIYTDGGVLLTGSNASGKSTFLKTVALEILLAQTIHTATATSYQAPFVRLLTSMSLRDDLTSGDSYYMAEIKSLKRILDAKKIPGEPVVCLIDEVLRGTNTVERIAASVEILKSLTDGAGICFAATHDIELTRLLQGKYVNYHFEEIIKEGDISFPYLLQKGSASTRNAILLLEIMGYPNEIITEAQELAHTFLQTGKWTSMEE